ncbi:MAG: hypothetical protein ABI528_06205 [bacterium]
MNKNKDILEDVKKFKKAKAPDGFLRDLHKKIEDEKRSLNKDVKKSKFRDLLNIFLQGKYLVPAVGLAVLVVIFFYVFKGVTDKSVDKDNIVLNPDVSIPIDAVREQADKLITEGKKFSQQGNDLLLRLMNERNSFLTLLPPGGFYPEFNFEGILTAGISNNDRHSFRTHFKPAYRLTPEEIRAKIDSLLKR